MGWTNLLTHQEQKIVVLVAQGLTNKEIAQQLGLSVFTVRNRMKVIMRKLELKNRVQVAHLSGQQANIKAEPAEAGTSYSLSKGISLG
jgi:DNA-binding NarL/FixJ family response regulator